MVIELDSRLVDEWHLVRFKPFVSSNTNNHLLHLDNSLTFNPVKSRVISRWSNFYVSKEYEGSRYRIYDNDNENGFVIADREFCHINIVGFDSIDDSKNQETLSSLLYIVFQQNILSKGAIFVHASVVVLNDMYAIVFCGESGVGKSTQANLWCRYIKNAWVLNYDRPIVFYENGSIFVSGSPWSGKEICYINRAFNVYSFIFLNRSTDSTLKRIEDKNAYKSIYYRYLPCLFLKNGAEKYKDMISLVTNKVPIYSYSCAKSIEAVIYLYTEFFGNIDKKETLKMRIKDCFIIRRVIDEYLVIPRGENALNFTETIVLNETGAFIWGILKNGCTFRELVESIAKEYDIPYQTAEEDASNFLNEIKPYELIDEQ